MLMGLPGKMNVNRVYKMIYGFVEKKRDQIHKENFRKEESWRLNIVIGIEIRIESKIVYMFLILK